MATSKELFNRDFLKYIPIISSIIFLLLIVGIYNIFNYKNTGAATKLNVDGIQIASASVIVSNYANSNKKSIERRNICVLSTGAFITNKEAVETALGDSKDRIFQNYKINVIRPCKV